MKLKELPASQKELSRPSCEEIKVISECEQSQKAVNVIIYDLFQSLKIYGKEPEALESIIRVFKMTLGEYTRVQVENAFRYYLKYFHGFPEPSDIVTIIERGGKPPFERSVYVSLMKKHADERNKDEWKYIKDYQDFIVKGEMLN